LVTETQDLKLGGTLAYSWHGTFFAGTIKWPGSTWKAHFNLLPSLLRPEEAEAIKSILADAQDEFDEDRDGVDEMITYEFIILSAGAAKSWDPFRKQLRQKLLDITLPIIQSRIEPFVRKRYPEARTVCHSMVRRYLHNERRTHGTHWDIPSFVSVVVSLDSAGKEFDGGFFVSTGTGLHSFIPLQQGDTVIHQGDLLHGVHVLRGNRWSWAMWFQDTPDCSSDPAGWWKDEAEGGDPVAQTLRAMRARNHAQAWKWVEAAARSGFPRALVYFGKAHQEGWNGQSKDLLKAAHWYRQARTAGDVDAAFYLGRVEREWGNTSGATALFKEGAEKGDPKAMEEVAALYVHGTSGAPRNLDLATHWFQQAADFTIEAMYQTHGLYAKGTESRTADHDMAALYLKRAAAMGHLQAMREVVEPLLRAKKWEEAIPWLLRLESGPPIAKFVDLYQQGVRIKPFALFRGQQILQAFADQGELGAKHLLTKLQSTALPRAEL